MIWRDTLGNDQSVAYALPQLLPDFAFLTKTSSGNLEVHMSRTWLHLENEDLSIRLWNNGRYGITFDAQLPHFTFTGGREASKVPFNNFRCEEVSMWPYAMGCGQSRAVFYDGAYLRELRQEGDEVLSIAKERFSLEKRYRDYQIWIGAEDLLQGSYGEEEKTLSVSEIGKAPLRMAKNFVDSRIKKIEGLARRLRD